MSRASWEVSCPPFLQQSWAQRNNLESAVGPVTVCLSLLVSGPWGGGEKTVAKNSRAFWTRYNLFLVFAMDGAHLTVKEEAGVDINETGSVSLLLPPSI